MHGRLSLSKIHVTFVPTTHQVPHSLLVHSSPHVAEMLVLSSFLVVAGAFLVKQH